MNRSSWVLYAEASDRNIELFVGLLERIPAVGAETLRDLHAAIATLAEQLT